MSDHLHTTRRDFLTRGLTLLSGASTLPVFLGATARALGSSAGRNDADPILVVVQLAGGNDGLNTIVPYELDGYYKSRPRLAIPRDRVLRLEQGVGLNPAATELKSLYDDGLMAVIQGVGYPNPNRSHFVSTDIWHTADPRMRTSSGWLGRYFDSCCGGADPGPAEPGKAVALVKETPLALTGDQFSPLAFENPEALTWRAARSDTRAAEQVFRQLNNITGDFPATDRSLEQFLQRAALDALVGADEIRSAAGRQLRGRRRGGAFARSLELIARMIAADMPTRVYYTALGGFDTHTSQEDRHRRLLTEFGEGLRDFLDTLREEQLLERVLVLCFSEFGRRVEENASGGTDHGEAAPVFVFGRQVRPGVHEDHPSLEKLHRGDLEFGCDFRRIYAGVLRDWMKTRPEKILGGDFSAYPIIKRG